MIFNSSRLSLAIAVAALVGGCGNYSNEDLEFMNALPNREDLSAQIPPSALSPADEAELSKMTHDTAGTFNGILGDVLGLIDNIRTYPPTTRSPNTRVWGPAQGDGGWWWRLTVTRTDAETFQYALEFHRALDPPDRWFRFIWGDFAASAGLRRGMGHLHAQTADLRANGFPLDNPDEDPLRTLDVTYSTREFPISVTMDLVISPRATPGIDASFHYEYEAQSNGQGAMRFRVTADLIPNTPVQEVLSVIARWLPFGAGRADAVIEAGDGMGLTHSQCWDSSFRQTFNRKAWDTSMDFQDESFCPAIPALSSL